MSETRADDDPLYPVLAALTGRKLTMAEVYTAVGLSKARYYEARKEGTLTRPDRLIIAAHHLGINPVELLVECSPGITVRDAIQYVEKRRAEVNEFVEATNRSPLAVMTRERGTVMARPTEFFRRAGDVPPL
jgi:hypothetical protein